MYSFEQITDMVQIYGKADRNHYEAKSIYAQKFSFHKICNEKIFQRAIQRIKPSIRMLLLQESQKLLLYKRNNASKYRN